MLTERDFLDDLWRDLAGLPSRPEPRRIPPPDVLWRLQWSESFERRRRLRMVMGAFRYGILGAHDYLVRECAKAAIRRLQMYLETGNQECLADASNLCMIEYVEPSVPGAHWRSVDDGEHVE